MDSVDTVILDRPGAFYLWTVMSATTEELAWDRKAVDGLIRQADRILAGSASDPSLSLRRAHDGLNSLAVDLKSRLDQIDSLWADVERIEELSARIIDWQVSDSATQLDLLVRNRRERISAFMGGDEEATQMIVELIDGGLDFANAVGITEQRMFNLRVSEVLANRGGSLAEAQEHVHHLDHQLAVLNANGFFGEDAVVGVGLAVSLGIDAIEVVEVVAQQGVDLVDAVAWIASSRALGVSVPELRALRGFRENLDDLDNPSGGRTDGKVSIGDLRYVVKHPWKFAEPTVIAAQALLDHPGLWNRLDTAARNEDLFVGEVFGSDNPGDGVVSLDDLEMFMVKSQIHSVLKEYRDEIDIAADASAEVDGFYSRADFRRFIEDNPHLPDEVLVAADAVLEAGWFDRTWFEEHRDELALGAAVLAGGAVILLSAGSATPLVLAAGAAAGAGAAGGTALAINLTGDANDAFDGVIRNIRNGAVVGFTVAGLPTAVKSVGATTGVAKIEAVSIAATDVAAVAACGALDIVVPEDWEADVHATAGLAVSASTAWSVGGDVTSTDPAPQSVGSLEGGLDAAANLIGCEAPDDADETPQWAQTAESYLRSSTDARSVFDAVRGDSGAGPAAE
ncbi:MAG: hypothetical protein OXN44_12570 [Acidimicrobiaceae bacterium]|nr:hypothetical protein [Acidimicrobiaceae bacterium]